MTQKQQINAAAAAAIACADGWATPVGFDFVAIRSDVVAGPAKNMDEHKRRTRSLRFLALAEAAFEAITGDSPDYSDDEDDASDNYPCQKCGAPRTKAQGGTTFTLCDACWDSKRENTEVTHGPSAGRCCLASG